MELPLFQQRGIALHNRTLRSVPSVCMLKHGASCDKAMPKALTEKDH